MTPLTTTVGASVRERTGRASVAAVEPTPIFADLVRTERPRPTPHGSHRTHGGGRSVTDLLRELRDDTPQPARVGRVPGLLTFPSRP